MPPTHDGLTFERLGHASVRIGTSDGRVLYVDPWSDVIVAPPTDGDVVFVTHDDFDHWDPDGIDAVAGPDATVAVYEGVDTSDYDRETVTLPAESSVVVDGVAVETLPAYNDPDGPHLDDEGNPFHAVGEVIGLLLTIDGVAVYFPSDTDFLPELSDVRADVFLPPIGGHYTMDRHEAADFAESVDPELVLPVHYDTFEAVETDAEAFRTDLEGRGLRVELF